MQPLQAAAASAATAAGVQGGAGAGVGVGGLASSWSHEVLPLSLPPHGDEDDDDDDASRAAGYRGLPRHTGGGASASASAPGEAAASAADGGGGASGMDAVMLMDGVPAVRLPSGAQHHHHHHRPSSSHIWSGSGAIMSGSIAPDMHLTAMMQLTGQDSYLQQQHTAAAPSSLGLSILQGIAK